MNKVLLSALSLLVAFSCSKLQYDSESQVDDTTYISANDTADKEYFDSKIKVKFTNTYKGLYVDNERIARADPANPDKVFIKLVSEARKTIDIAIFDIDEETTCNALIKAKKRGVKVRIVTDSDNLNDKVRPSQPRQAIENMKAAGIPIVEDQRSGLMHNKFAVIDNQTVLTGSLNLTVNALFRDNNNALRIVSKELAQNYNAEFERLFTQKIFGPNDHAIPFKTVNVAGAEISLYFSPKGGTGLAALEEIKKAKKSIKFMTFSLTDKDILEALIAKNKEGVKIEGLFDGCMISKYSLYYTLLKNDVLVHIDGNQALLHNKVFIIDDNTIITGSYNFSKNAENNNNENTLIIKSPRLAITYNQEFKKLVHASEVNTNLPPYDNRTCGSQDNGNDDTQAALKKAK